MNQMTTAPAPTETAERSTPTETGSLLRIIADAAANPAVDVTKMQALLDMQERILNRQAEASFNAALARLTANMPRVKKNGTIDMTRKDGSNGGSIPFARWEDVDDVIRPLMRQEGFTLSFNAQPRSGEGGGAIVSGTLLHRDGHSKTTAVPLALDNGPGRNNLQAMGSTLSYGKRYCAEMLLNIVREGADDDGHAGGAEYITVEQANNLSAQLDALQGDPEQFLAFMKATSFQDIRKSDFAKATNALAAKRRKQGGGQ